MATRSRLAAGTAHEPGRDYRGSAELLAELRADPRVAAGATAASWSPTGCWPTCERTVAVFGLHLATMDMREHADAHHHAVGQLVDRLGVESLALRRPAPGLPHPAAVPGAGRAPAALALPRRRWTRPARKTFAVFTEIRDALERFGPR